MKRVIIILFLSILGFINIGNTQNNVPIKKPSKIETEEWIKTKISEWAAPIHQYQINFYENKIAIKNIPDNELGTNIPWVFVAPLNEIRSIYFSTESSNSNLLIMYFTVKSGEKKIYENFGGMESFVSEQLVVLNKSSCTIENQNRLIKAFNNLISIHGGKVVKEVY